ncbi:efflux RND transporter permease subunit [Haematomicrobium sanguinis]|uniref:efflux RND transporter permease subunit n=1 Tax=Haematomicrobium sanguinis TaxID=479106 RepID=UPI00068BE7E9|nr:efflux RND transporter permease subunit [Haematomicrobium sanguinis]
MGILATLSLKNRALIALITVLVAIFGGITLSSLKQELIPSLDFPRVSVVSAYSGASPAVVDAQVSRPLESALRAVEGLESSSSVSRSGFSTVSLTFEYGTNLDRARSQVDRAIANVAPNLPDGVQPQALAGSVSDFPVIFAAVSSDRSLSELRGDVERLALPEIQKLDGVRSADLTGGTSQHIQITPDARAMAAASVSVSDISDALSNSGSLVPIGVLNTDGKTLTVQAGSPIDSLGVIKGLPLAGSSPGASAPATIGSVAAVSIQDDVPTAITRTNGEETLSLSITKVPNGDIVGLSQAFEELVPALEEKLGNGATFTTVFDQAPFIEKSISDLRTEGLLGLAFAVLVILVFLLSVRSTLVTAISIPLSLLVTFIGLYASGYSLNILTLGALTIAIGRVVDDSIVVIENISRHLGYGIGKREAIVRAVREVAGAITASTLTTVAVFAPIAFVGGLAGELFRPFALTVTIALLASLIVSLTIVPVLAYWFLKPKRSRHAHAASAGPVGGSVAGSDAGPDAQADSVSGAYLERNALQRGYAPVLALTQRHPVWTVALSLVIVIGTFALIPLLKVNLLGSSGQNSFSITQKMAPGSSLDTTAAAASKVEDILKNDGEVQTYQLNIGDAQGGLAARLLGGTSQATFTVITQEGADQTGIQDRIRAEIGKLKGAGEITLSSQEGGFGGASTVDVNVSAPDTPTLVKANEAVLSNLGNLSSASDVSSNLAEDLPQIQVTVDRAKAAQLGLSEAQIGAVAGSAISPIPAGTIRFDVRDYPVLIGEGQQLTDIAQIRNLNIPTAGGPVPLSDIASVAEVNVPVSISSANGQRTATISVTPNSDNLGATISEVNARVDGVELPPGATLSVGGAAQSQQESFSQLFWALLAAVAIVYVIMVATFKSLVQPLVLLVSIPFAATGAIALLVISQVPLGLPSLIGMLMLVGIVVTNAIVLIDLINQYRRDDGARAAMPLAEAISVGALQRLRPILMTALATIFALIPMALGLTGEGGFISQPLAIVVIGGLISSTALTLILVPVLYRLVEGFKERRAAKKA